MRTALYVAARQAEPMPSALAHICRADQMRQHIALILSARGLSISADMAVTLWRWSCLDSGDLRLCTTALGGLSAGVSISYQKRLALMDGLIVETVGEDRRTRRLGLTDKGRELAACLADARLDELDGRRPLGQGPLERSLAV